MKCADGGRDPHERMCSLQELPPPGEAAQQASEALVAQVRQAIDEAGGAISFARFMELVLYAPALGYYSGGSHKFGELGDFITAPELSPLFSWCVARQCAQILDGMSGGDLLEFGAGSGVMATEMLTELERCGALPEHYFILELSGELRQRQRETVIARIPHLAARVTWLDALPDAFRGVILGNEVLDAMPVHRFTVTGDGVHEIGVGWCDGRCVDVILPEITPKVSDALTHLVEETGLPEGYHSEINIAAREWIATLATLLEEGAILLFDYGFPRREYYHPQRSEGTLMCHYRHRSHTDPYRFVGLQDITAHVDFTSIAESAYQQGLHVAGFATQALFLLSTGLLEMASEPRQLREQMETANQIRRLTQPEEMGELFKVIALTRGIDMPLIGFRMRDDRGRL